MSRSTAPQVSGTTDAVPTVLIVDDRRENLLALEAVLEPLGVRIVRATSGRQAVERCGQQEFAVVVLDVMMPGADGLETARLLKEAGMSRLTPIIFLTAAEVDRRRVHDGYASGAVDYLFKPIDPEVLRAKVAAFVDLYRNRHAEHWQQRRRYADQAAAAAEAAYREGEQQFRLLAESVPAMVWTARSDGDIETLNAFGAEYVGARAAALTELRWTDHVHPDDVPVARRQWAHAVRTGSPFEVEVRIWSVARGAFRRHIARAVPRRGSAGEVVGWIGVNADVEDSKRAEEEAHELQLTAEREARIAADDARAELARAVDRLARLQSLTAALSEAATPSQVAQAVVVNGMAALRASAALIAVVDQRAVGSAPVLRLVDGLGYPPDVLDAWREIPIDAAVPLAEAVRTGRAIAVGGPRERVQRYPDLATVRPLYASVYALPLIAHGRIIGVMGLSFDGPLMLTPDDQTLADAIARQCAQALHRAELYEQAQEANRAKASFLAAVSHDLRQPLNASLGFLEIALLGIRGDVPPALREDLERIRRNQQHLLALINDVLSFARVEAGQLLVRREIVPLGEIFEALPSLVAPQADEKGVLLRIAACPSTLSVLGDRERVIQVFTNLLTNAIKATPTGGTVTLDHSCGGDVVLAHVRDTGVGISPDHLARIFEPFVQVARSFNHPTEGIGLGLSISRNLARAMGGDLTVESTVGEGSVFTVRLPGAGTIASLPVTTATG